jgi:hypothetical protein
MCTLRLSCNEVMLHNPRGDSKAKQPVRVEPSRKSKDNLVK